MCGLVGLVNEYVSRTLLCFALVHSRHTQEVGEGKDIPLPPWLYPSPSEIMNEHCIQLISGALFIDQTTKLTGKY